MQIIVVLLILSCSTTRYEGNKIFSDSNLRRDFIKNCNQWNLMPYSSITLATENNENHLLILFDIDSLILNVTLNKYTCLFTSGLITPQMLAGPYGCSYKINQICEITNPDRKTKIHRYVIDGDISPTASCHRKYYFYGDRTYIELKNEKAYRSNDLKEFVLKAKVTFTCNTLMN